MPLRRGDGISAQRSDRAPPIFQVKMGPLCTTDPIGEGPGSLQLLGPYPAAVVPGGLQPNASRFVGWSCLLRRPLPRWQAGRRILSHATTSLRAIPRAALEQRWGAQRLLFECEITPVNLNRHSSSSARGGVGAGQTFKVKRDHVLLRGTETPRRGPDSNFCDLKRPSEARHKEIS